MRKLVTVGTVVGTLGALLWACGSSKPVQSHKPDAGVDGGTGKICSADSQCALGTFCIQGICTTCQHAVCPAETACAPSGQCQATTHSGDAGTACTHRQDCPGAFACLNGECGSPAPDAGCGSDDQCSKANVCLSGHCTPGCRNNLDCHGTNSPKCYPGTPVGHCGACTRSGDCLAGELCQSGRCVSPQDCSDAGVSACGNLACIAGHCSPCTQSGQCPASNTCDADAGHCVAGPQGCTSDAQCQSQRGPAYWCDSSQSPPQCLLGCLPDSQCATAQPDCCSLSTQTCNASTHHCTGRATSGSGGTTTSGTTSGTASGSTGGTTGGCDCASLGCSVFGLECDPNACTCVSPGGSGSTGGTTGSCDCASLGCDTFGLTCDPGSCTCVPPGGTGSTGGTTGGTTGGCDCTFSPCAFFGLGCDPSTCNCVAPGSGSTGGTGTSGGTSGSSGTSCGPYGDVGLPCGPDCKCNTGTCTDFFGQITTDAQSCSLGYSDACFAFDPYTCE